MTISVALCTFNGERFLREQLESLAAQSRLPDELVACDDGSHDATMSLLSEFASSAPFRVHVHRNPQNLGSTRNFDQAIALCDSDIIALCDQDDVWRADKLARLERAFESSPRAAFAFSNAIVTDQDGTPHATQLWPAIGLTLDVQRALRSPRAFQTLLSRTVVTGATMAFRARFRPLLSPIDSQGPLIHDAWIATLLSSVAEVALLHEPLIFYRRHAEQQTHNAGRETLTPDFYRAHLRQLGAMRERLQTVGANFGDVTQPLRTLDEKISHLQARLNLPESKLARAANIARQTLNGNYARHSNGWRSAAKDLLR